MQNDAFYDSPLGRIRMTAEGDALIALRFDGEDKDLLVSEQTGPATTETARWLDAYFRGEKPADPPKIRLNGTPFRLDVWALLRSIPYGKTVSYGEIADMLRAKGYARVSARAVGNAVAHNPVLLIVPCHRVIGADGKLTGYAGGTDRKKKLLELEQKNGK